MALYQFVPQGEMQKKGQVDDGGIGRGQIIERHVHSKEKGRGLHLRETACGAHSCSHSIWEADRWMTTSLTKDEHSYISSCVM